MSLTHTDNGPRLSWRNALIQRRRDRSYGRERNPRCPLHVCRLAARTSVLRAHTDRSPRPSPAACSISARSSCVTRMRRVSESFSASPLVGLPTGFVVVLMVLLSCHKKSCESSVYSLASLRYLCHNNEYQSRASTNKVKRNMANRLKPEKRKMVLRMLCEGSSIRSTARVTGVDKDTVCRTILRFGQASHEFLDDKMQDLTLAKLEADEIWTFCGKKNARLTAEEKATRHDIGDIYLWTVIDAETKLVPTFVLGKRSADNARRLMVDLRSRLTMPNPHASDDHAYSEGRYEPVTQISTDGLAAYPEAVDLAFGPHVKFGVIIKEYRNAKLQYDPSEIVGTIRRPIKGGITPRQICTSHVERHNGTIRTFMRRFTRLSNGFSKKFENLQAAVAMFMAHYNFVWRTRYPNKSGQSGRKRPTAAMMAKITDRLWSFDDLYEQVGLYG